MIWAEQVSPTTSSGSFAEDVAKEAALIYDIRCPDIDDEPCFYIMQIDPAKHNRFKAALESTARFNMSDYGELLYFGRGEPSDELKAELTKAYGLYGSVH